MDKKINILFENNEIIIIDKPAGIAVQPGKNIKTTVIDILEKEQNKKFFPVHRLDMDTGGVLVAAKDKASANKYTNLFAGHEVEKIYLAVCAGHFISPNGVINEDIEIDGKKKRAETFFRVIKKFAKFSLLELRITTGRMHQIRIHLAGINHPVIGDDKYGDFKLNKEISVRYNIKNLMLFAVSIKIKGRKIKAEIPAHFKSFLKVFNITF